MTLNEVALKGSAIKVSLIKDILSGDYGVAPQLHALA